jgi:hypothetical protein
LRRVTRERVHALESYIPPALQIGKRMIRVWPYLIIMALAACNNNKVTLSGLPAPAEPGLPSTILFYTGKVQAFTVPAGVTQLNVTVDGAEGGGGQDYTPPGARGAEIRATIPVRPGQNLSIYVGGRGGLGGNNGPAGGGFNGGGAAFAQAYGGGGSSDVRTGPSLRDRILVAGGGGGSGETLQIFAGSSYYWCYGGGGGLGGGDHRGGRGTYGYCNGGNGGIGGAQGTGGSGGAGGPEGPGSRGSQPCKGAAGKSGALGAGGDGGGTCSGKGGGGGGGYYGGGGGGSGGCCGAQGGGGAGGGGGGGSSYVERSATNVRRLVGEGPLGDGQVMFTW